MHGGMLGFGVHRPVGMLMVVLAGVVFGLVSLTKLPVDLLPAIDYPSLTVRTAYPGAAPEDVEERVTEKLEDVLSTVGDLVRIRSSSRAEVSEILMEFEWGSNLPFLVQDVRERIDRVFLSQGVERPLILRYDPSLDPILRIAVAGGQDLVRLRDLAEQEIEREIEGLPGVAAVRVSGGLEDEIQVRVDPQRLASLQIAPELIRQRLTEENLNVPGGTLEEGATEYVVRTLNEFRTLEQIEELPIVRRGGASILLGDIARVVRTHKDRDVILRSNGAEAVEVEVFREDGANIVDVAERVRAELFGRPSAAPPGTDGPRRGLGALPVADKLPDDVTLTVLSDQSAFVSGAISEVRNAAAIGGLLAIAVCYLFLRRLAVTVIIGLSVPISVVATFGAMYGSGVTLNVMSLGGLALGIGMLVDNSIVVLESITRCREEGDPPLKAALRGVQEVGSAVTASTLTTIAVFAPIVFVEGVAGQTFGDQSLTVVASLLISLAVALFFIPGLAARTRLGVAGEERRAGPRVWWQAARQSWRRPSFARVPRSKLLWLAGIAGAVAAGWILGPLTGGMLAPYQAAAEGREPDVPAEVLARVSTLRWVGVVLAVPAIWTFGQVLVSLVLWLFTALLALAVFVGRLVFAGILVVFTGLLWPLGQAVRVALGAVERIYRPVLRGALRAPLLVMLVVAAVAWGTVETTRTLGRELLPEVLQGELTAELFFPAGSPLTETDAVATRLEAQVAQLDGVEETAVASGSDRESVSTEEEGPHTARILIRTGGDDPRATEMQVERELRRLLDREPALARYNLRRPTLLALNAPLEVEILGDDLDGIAATARQVQQVLAGVPGIVDLRSSLRRGNPEVRVTLDREQLARHGLTVAGVSDRLRLAVEGEVSSTFPGQDERIDIRVRADLSQMQHVEQLAALPVNPDAERPLTLGSVATLSVADGPSDIRHIGGRRAAVLSASLAGFDLGATAREVENRLAGLDLPPERSINLGGQTREMESALDSLSFALLLAVFLVYAVMAAQFESLVQPLLIMFSVPLAAAGAVAGLAATGTPISVVALLGAVVLAGIVVNNAIVLVDRINRNRQAGLALDEAIVEGGLTRMRPILMTTVTTVLGMLPLTGWFGAAEGTELRAPMALVVITGLTASTLLTLLVIPVGYRFLAVVSDRDRA